MVFLHPRFKQQPSRSSNNIPRFASDCYAPSCISSLASPPPAPVLPVLGDRPRGTCPGVCSRSLSPFTSPAFSSLLLPVPNWALLLLAAHQLHPHHLSQIVRLLSAHHFPFFSPGAPWFFAGMCRFRVSHTAVMRIVFPQVAFGGSSHHSFQSLWIPLVPFPLKFDFLSPWVSCFSIVSFLPVLSPGSSSVLGKIPSVAAPLC